MYSTCNTESVVCSESTDKSERLLLIFPVVKKSSSASMMLSIDCGCYCSGLKVIVDLTLLLEAMPKGPPPNSLESFERLLSMSA